MSIAKRVLIGLVTFLPLVSFIAFAVNVVTVMGYGEDPAVDEIIGFFIGMAIFYLLIIITQIVNMIIYINHTVKNPRIDSNSKVLWLCLLFFFNIIVTVIYYFLYIVTDRPITEKPTTVTE